MAASVSEKKLIRRWRSLNPDQQRTALDFVEFLGQKSEAKRPRRSLLGICATPGFHVSVDDIDEARREMLCGMPSAN